MMQCAKRLFYSSPSVDIWVSRRRVRDTLFINTVSATHKCIDETISSPAVTAKSSAIAFCQVMPRDDVAPLAMPGAHHKALLRQAHAQHRDRLIDADDLSEMLEFADAALVYAIEVLLDLDGNA